jgi:hypothetical protein
VPGYLTTGGIVGAIGTLWPGNPLIDHWLGLNAAGLANAATPEQVDFAIRFMQGLQTIFDFGNPLPSDPINPEPFAVDPLVANITQLMQVSGVQAVVQVAADLAGFQPATFGPDATDLVLPA